MPCYDDRDDRDRHGIQELQCKLDRITRVACDMGRAITRLRREGFLGTTMLTETEKWIGEHKEFDRKRGEPW